MREQQILSIQTGHVATQEEPGPLQLKGVGLAVESPETPYVPDSFIAEETPAGELLSPIALAARSQAATGKPGQSLDTANKNSFLVQQIERNIRYDVLKRAFQASAEKVESFIKQHLAHMLGTLLETGKTQTEVFCDGAKLFFLKARRFQGEIQILAKTPIGQGAFKYVDKVSNLFGPSIPNQPASSYAYAKLNDRKALKQKIQDLEYFLQMAVLPHERIALGKALDKCKALLEYREAALRAEIALSKELPALGCVRMWSVCNQKDPAHLKGVMMECCDGGNLWEFIGGLRYPLTRRRLEQVLELARSISQTLADIHKCGLKGICHLDLKSGNILLKRQGKGLAIKITDFGLATKGGAALTYPRGTPPYMAPEHFDTTRTASPAMDSWSLGIILVELLYGRQANLFHSDPSVQRVEQDFFVSECYASNKAAWRRIGAEICKSLNRYPEVDPIIRGLLRLDPKARLTSQKAADKLSAILKKLKKKKKRATDGG